MEGSSNSDCPQSIPSTGLTVVVNPEEPDLDIVFVHGFTGHPERTWMHKKCDVGHRASDGNGEPPSKMRKLNPFSKSNRESSSPSVYWPRDLIPITVPNARVLTFGYDTHIRHVLGPSGSKNTVYDIAWDFLVALEAKRREEPLRPILFIVHSLGGIVVKEMLRRSSGCRRGQAHLQDIFESTRGIIFFGTPHSGADPRGILQHVAEKVIKIMGFTVNEQIVNTLLPTAERLRELRDEFGPMVLEQDWRIHSFQEQLGVPALSGLKVVEDTSSYLNLPSVEVSQHIGRNHMDMCRFTGPNDVEYEKVAFVLHRLTTSIPNRRRGAQELSLTSEQKNMLMDSLRFEQLHARQRTMKQAHSKTCKWLLKYPSWLDWLDDTKRSEHHGFLWIKGKPGTGKSTLMKFALDNALKQRKDQTILSFFFNARGDELEKTTMGTYRSLLLQLLEKLPKLKCVFDSLGLSATAALTSYQWSIESLKDLLEQAIQMLGTSPVVCFIDALDECDEDQIRDMVSFFEHVGEFAVSSGIKFHVCFSSRHYPYISIRKSQSLVLEGQEGHNQDISNYLNSELAIGTSDLAEQIRIELQTKASGIFMWVVLVVGILNKEYDKGRMHALSQKLREIPRDLHELFRSILTRDSDDKDELILCIQWVLFSKQPLTPEQLYFAIRSGVESRTVVQRDHRMITRDVIKKFILNSSKGLAEITRSSVRRVQFIHESVRDFLLKGNGLSLIWIQGGNNFQGQSHQKLKQCCLNYVRIDNSAHPELNKGPYKASSEDAAKQCRSISDAYPFLEYAVRNVLYHADAAAQSGIAQKDVIDNFPIDSWVTINNLFEKADIRRYTKDVSLLYVLAEHNLSALVQAHPSILSCFKVGNERYGPPFFASLATGSKQTINTFARACALNQPPESRLYQICSQYSWLEGTTDRFKRDFKFSRRKTVLSYVMEISSEEILALFLATGTLDVGPDERIPLLWAARSNLEAAVEILLATGKADIHSKDNRGRTPLSWAAENGNKAAVKMLLATDKVDVDSKDEYGRTPLMLAALNGHKAVVEMLLATGKVDVDSKNNFDHTPLSWAIRNGHKAVVKMLLATGKVDLNSKNDFGQTPLSWAARRGLSAIVEMLLAMGKVDVDSKDNSERTPLSWAASNGCKAVAEMLLATGKVDVDSKDKDEQTPLSLAARNGHGAVAKALLATDKVDVDFQDKGGRTPLSRASEIGEESIVEMLLATGKVDVDSKDRDKQTPLSWAARNGRAAATEMLLATGKVDIDPKDCIERTPLSLAARNGHETIVKMLLTTGKVDVDSKDRYFGQTPLSWASENGHEAVVKMLLATGKVDVDSKDSGERTPLWWAAKNGRAAVTEMLLATGKVDVDSKDMHARQTPLSRASEDGREAVVEMLLATGKVDVNSKDSDEHTPLSWAAKNGRAAVTEMLLATGKVDVNSKDKGGQTPLSLAARNGHEEVVEMLLATGKVDVDSKDGMSGRHCRGQQRTGAKQ